MDKLFKFKDVVKNNSTNIFYIDNVIKLILTLISD